MNALLLIGVLWLTPEPHAVVVELPAMREPCAGTRWNVQRGSERVPAAVAVYDIPSGRLLYAPSVPVAGRIICAGFE